MSAMLGHLRTRFPGFERSMGEAIHELVNHERKKDGHPIKQVHGWVEVRHAYPDDALSNFGGIDWVAYLHARVYGGETYTVPVVPDEFNPRPDKIVRPDDKPHIFHLMHEADEAAQRELPGFVRYIESKL